ncbi:hypothetical protein DAEQUDRAFT_733590 [Daedalea quercina L-15889]|uniref:Uncharacterized protein n=1 Tax=Daedalea quercina L-15889 TaxID=1314783 RepID=A0A165KVV5_9APHY|nr:hypothetical protein DAEQUDRAFT_733590 [Daedalea quercina L-15889]
MDGAGRHLPEDAPSSYAEMPVRVDTTPEASLAVASDGHPILASDANIVAHTVELPPDAETSADARLDLKDPDVKDIGWNKDMGHLPPTIINGLSNDDLFLLIRRFNKQIQHVKTIPEPPPGHLDLEISENEEFSPDKLRSHLERLYMNVILGIAAYGKHVARIRSWNEARRTAGFCIAYYIAWWSNLLGALACTTIIVLILHPPARKWLFPPAPLAAVSAFSGNLQVPRAGTIGSKDSLSGAPESHRGEAAEQEANNFVSGLGSLALATATGQQVGPSADPKDVPDEKLAQQQQEDTGVQGVVPDPTEMAGITTDAMDAAHGARTDGKHDATKKHVESAMWDKARPIMRALADFVDTWERFGNVLSPTPPFSHAPRLRLATLVLPVLVATTTVPAAFFVKGATFAVGFVIFGQPLMTRGIHWLNANYPNWPQMLEMRRSILKGVPTNAQLALALLRIGEASHTPLPPPPSTNLAVEEPDTHPDSAKAEVAQHADEHLDFDTSNYEIEGADKVNHADGHAEQDGKGKPKTSRLVKLVKGSMKASVSSAIGVDHLKAKLGSDAAKRRLGAVPDDKPDGTISGPTGSRVGLGDGPTTYAARYHGKRGYVVLVMGAATPCVSFVWEKDLAKNLASYAKAAVSKAKDAVGVTDKGGEPEVPPAVFAIPLAEIQGLRKVGGYGWKGKMIIGYALRREVVDGLGIEDKNGKPQYLTAIKGRDELFNRLIALGGHKWEQL